MDSLLKKIDDLVSLIDINSNVPFKQTCLIFIAGPSGAGKTTLGENLKNREQDFIHYDCDHFMCGSDPIKNAGKVIQKDETWSKRSPQLVKAYEVLLTGYECVWNGQKSTLAQWRPFYDLMIADIRKARLTHPNKHIAITQSVYAKIARDHIRSELGDDLYFILIDIDPNICTERIMSRIHEQAAQIDKTAEEYLKQWGKTVEGYKTGQAQRQPRGFERKSDDETNTFQIDANGMTKEEVFASAQKILRQIGIPDSSLT